MRKECGNVVKMRSIYLFHGEKGAIMSWKTINYLLGLAAVDQQFWQELKRDPLAVSQRLGVQLTSEEKTVLSKIKAETLAEFSQLLLDELGNQSN
jgi:hypothetical protein